MVSQGLEKLCPNLASSLNMDNSLTFFAFVFYLD